MKFKNKNKDQYTNAIGVPEVFKSDSSYIRMQLANGKSLAKLALEKGVCIPAGIGDNRGYNNIDNFNTAISLLFDGEEKDFYLNVAEKIIEFYGQAGDHPDPNPGNIIIDTKERRIRLIDFGDNKR